MQSVLNIMKYISIFTDGAVPNNQLQGNRKGGVGVFFAKVHTQNEVSNDDIRNISFSIKETKEIKVTNQVCELLACIKGLETIVTTQNIGKNEIIIYTDSMYIINSITEWAKNWEKNNWKKADNKPIQNLELVKKLYYLAKNLKVGFKHVKAHTNPPEKDSDEYFEWYGNYMADKLAVQASLK